MLTIRGNGREIANAMGKVTKEIIEGYKQSIKEIAREGKRIAKELAPVKSRATRESIHYKTFNTKAELYMIPIVPFPHNVWANRQEPFRILHFRRRNKYFAVPQEVGYGMHLISPSGNPIQWTGTAGFFDIARDRMDAMIEDNLNPKIERALRKK